MAEVLIEILTDSLEPALHPSDLVMVETRRDPTTGDVVALHDGGACTLGRLTDSTAGMVLVSPPVLTWTDAPVWI
jgi:phage repressor protein C with HTH and peptisase S24 domain